MGQEIILPEHIKVEIWNGHWTRQDAIDNPDKLFLFGGNFLQDQLQSCPTIPTKTQAVIRGLHNNLPINTKWTNGTHDSAYLRDVDAMDYNSYLHETKLHLELMLRHRKIIVLPSKENGIGTGTAYLQQKAPKCWELLQTFLAPLYERAEKSVISED